MYKKILILTILLCLIGFATACKSDEHICPPTPEPISLLGVWYEVGATKKQGLKFVFVDKHHFSHWYYVNYDEDTPSGVLYDNINSYISYNVNLSPNDGVIHLIDSEGRLRLGHTWTFKNDTLVIGYFIPHHSPNYLDLYLTRSVQVG